MKKISILSTTSYGHFNITIEYRRKLYYAITTNTQAIDRYRYSDVSDLVRKEYGMTKKQALMQLYNECKTKNNLK